MKQYLSLFALVAACVAPAEAQNRRPARRPRTSTPAAHPAPPPAPTPTPAAIDGGARNPRWVVQRGAGTWAPSCIAAEGCEVPRTIPRCAPPPPNVRLAAPLTFAQLSDQRASLSGHEVAVRATLSASVAITEMGCPQAQCCNFGRGAVSIAGASGASLRRVALGVENDPTFACQGDDSGLCCGTEVPSGEVVVRGTLRPIPNSGGEYRIESPTLCQP